MLVDGVERRRNGDHEADMAGQNAGVLRLAEFDEGRDRVPGIADIVEHDIFCGRAGFQAMPGPVLPLVRRGLVAPVAFRGRRLQQRMGGKTRSQPFQPAQALAGLAVRNAPDGVAQKAADLGEHGGGVGQRNAADQEKLSGGRQARRPVRND